MWIPRRLYESLPLLYMAAGAAAFAAAFLREGGPHGLLMFLGGLALTAGLLLWMRRRDYRRNQAEYDTHSLDE